MNYYTPAPPRATRRQHFLLGLASGVFVMAAVMLLMALALICSPAGLPIYTEGQWIPAKLESNPPTFACFGATK